MHVVTFYSTSVAIRAEKVARSAGCIVKLIPMPRHLSADCGTALRVQSEDLDKIRMLFADSRVQFTEMVPLDLV